MNERLDRGPSRHYGEPGSPLQGVSTPVMTWMTPLVAVTSAFLILMPLTLAPPARLRQQQQQQQHRMHERCYRRISRGAAQRSASLPLKVDRPRGQVPPHHMALDSPTEAAARSPELELAAAQGGGLHALREVGAGHLAGHHVVLDNGRQALQPAMWCSSVYVWVGVGC